jgi:hypothetical protein
MNRTSKRLSVLKIAQARQPGMFADGDGLYLQVSNANSRSWIFRYRRNGKQREMGLGPLNAVSLASARQKALECRTQLADGIDPLAAREAKRARQAIEEARGITFDQCAAAYIKAHAGSWKSPVHHLQWETTLATYVSPVFGSLPVQAVDVGLVMKVLEPIWTTKSETSSAVTPRRLPRTVSDIHRCRRRSHPLMSFEVTEVFVTLTRVPTLLPTGHQWAKRASR